ncbi:hypothetical protein [Halapricum hydrolyticum]|uniref:Uncharacterized protein n=1 Tax=Halapricum hydrolyticum TaxID=2979991 RepID=A0AAE3IAF3_9EURY|nr:hypothetical protein [Halapricum hydrolyticum]MCU4717742.1 hypothetical protein [Halapricum hydrolyticum]MCU4726906.1 hypothetical protein [Halapricum hydrolyticum]
MTERRQATSKVERERDEDDESRAHVSDVEVGAGCTEIWEHLSEQRSEASDD